MLINTLKKIGDHFLDCLAITSSDSERRCLFVNSAFEAQTGYTPGEVLGRNLALLQGSATSPHVVRKMRQSFEVEAAFCGDVANYRKDGSMFRNRLVILPIESYHETYLLGFQNTVHDLDEGMRDRSQGEINHVLKNALSIVVLSADAALDSGQDIDQALDKCASVFREINEFCRGLESAADFSIYNPFQDSPALA